MEGGTCWPPRHVLGYNPAENVTATVSGFQTSKALLTANSVRSQCHFDIYIRIQPEGFSSPSFVLSSKGYLGIISIRLEVLYHSKLPK